ncbi:hypothetical protein JAAARDRAFT_31918 [Jaapia argillacea MUCL 33604]|uniref:Small ribosomal subunit protein mS38 n=1 Tax=Jaapia argillacea MUCL 33604 TaxID=933084 RepID=A0A067QEC7_9AGAM|nr:hypothetical protein JAAARDRAFT_31918 [Jaapia argillacea MUCL 33604]
MLSRLLKAPPASRRTYSFFSSKPGGGRYFNSTKPPKVITSTHGSSGSGGSGGSGSGKSAKSDATSGVAGTGPGSSGDASSPGGVGKKPEELSAPSPNSQKKDPLPIHTIPTLNHAPFAIHPAMNPQDLKLHQFFSLHRPLLLLSLPASSVFESQPTFTPSLEESPPAKMESLEDPPEASPEADADAARQLARALVMNRVGSTVSWESTLQRLGMDVAQGRTTPVDLSPLQVYMDSVKRKRRKKMNKHKLKKRRRLQRAQRIKTGK